MTLTETAAATKKWARLILIFGSIFLVFWLIFLYIYNNIYIPYQKNQIRAEQKFGPLPKPKFPTSIAASSAFQYSLDTNSGGLPTNTPKLLNVYFIPPQEPSLLAPERASKLATSLGFNPEPEILSPGEYRYSDPYGGQLTVELSTGNFNFTKVIPNQIDNKPLGQDPTLPSDDAISSGLSFFLQGNSILQENFNKPRVIITYDNPNRQLAQTARVSFWPNNVGEIPVVTDNPTTGPITAIVTKYNNQLFRYSKLNYSVWTYDKQTFSTYAMLSIDKAFENLKAGQGVVIKSNGGGGPASVTKIYVAYYMSAQYQAYLEPVYVFESDSFTAYIPALTPESYAK